MAHVPHGGRRAAALAALAAALAFRADALDPSRTPAQYVHQRYETRDGLPQNLVRALAQTPDGYLWVATDEGLARFDGARFTVLDRRNQPGMPTNLLTALAPDGAGGLWAGTVDEGLLRVRDGEVSAVPLAGASGERIAGVRALARDGRGDLWVGTRDRGLIQLRGEAVVRCYGAPDGLPGEDVLTVQVDAAGELWVGTDRGVVRIRDGEVKPGPPELSGVAVAGVATDPAGDVWFATRGRGVAWLRQGRLRFLGARDGLPSDEVEAILRDRDGNVWAGTLLGLALVRGGVVSSAAAMPDRIAALFEDGEGALWVGGETGLDRLREGDFRTYGVPEGLTSADVNSVVELPDGSIWLGTVAGLFRSQGERFEQVLAGGRPLGYVVALHLDARGHLWVSTRGERGTWLSEWHEGRPVRSWPDAPGRPTVYSIASRPDGTVWLGTKRGVYRLRGQDPEPVPGFQGRVNSVAFDRDGMLWAATDLASVWRLEGGRLVPAPGEGPPRQRTAVAVFPEQDGTLWVTTEGSGLWRLRDGRWASLGRPEGMFDDVVWTVLDDGRGRLWFSSNRGVWWVERRQLEERIAGARTSPVTSVAYGEADGMRARECNAGQTPAGLRSRDGRLWFPTTEGLAVVDPARLRPRPPPVPATLEAVHVDGRSVHPGAALELPAKAARLEIAFTGVTLIEPERLRFRYRLDGFDAGWIEAGAARLATYTNLPPGRYRFEVQAGTAEGWGPAAAVGVRKLPRLDQTWWFWALAGTAVALLALGAHLARIWALRAHEAELERRVREALAEVKTLSGLIPMCAWCKKIRDDQGYWQRLESYLAQRSQAQFSHGMCPECYEREQAEAAAREAAKAGS